MCTIRTATVDDFPAITRLVKNREELFLLHPCGSYPWTVEQIARLSEERFDLTVMEEGDRVIGFANLYGMKDNAHAFIGNVIIDSNHRARGLGRRLITYMMERVFDTHSLSEARISVFADNKSALDLYTALGFHTYDEEERLAPTGESLRLLHMRLTDNA